MLKKITWRVGDVYAVKVREGLYLLAQMKENHLMEFFDVRRADPVWSGVDLNVEPMLFCVFVAEKRLLPMLVERLGEESVRPNRRATPTRMLNALFGPGPSGAELVELTPEFSSVGARVVQGPLRVDTDLATIHAHELTGMVGDPAKLAARLARYVDTGINWDDSKRFLFPGIEAPSA